MRVEGKTVLVTGAAGGLGCALSIELARRGARLILTGLSQAPLNDVRADIESMGGEAIAIVGDVQKERDVRALVDNALATWGRIDILINNAGITSGGDIRVVADDDWERVLNVNLWGTIRTVRAVLPHMIDRGSGYIVNIASAAGLIAAGLWAPYAVSKFAVVGFSESLCAAYRSKGIGVSVVCPLCVRTNLSKGVRPHVVPPAALSGPHRIDRMWRWFVTHFPRPYLSVDVAARRIVRGMEREQFLVYTHGWTYPIIVARAIAPQLFSRLWSRANAATEARYQRFP